MTADALLVQDFISKSINELIIDVRAPIEFAKGHIPNALNIPLFEDVERAEIGTLYKQQGKEIAVNRGLELVSPKMVAFVNRVKLLAKSKKVFVYCFRGGMRSNSFAWLMNTSGLEAKICEGGYKAYRNHVLNSFENPLKLIVLGGRTGSGKTDVLKSLQVKGIQIVDLEGIANHKGSAFGAINENPQPNQQDFEHQLFQAILNLDHSKPILIEDESATIGKVKIPHAFWKQKIAAKILKIEVSFENRVKKLVNDYATVDINSLKACVLKISSQLGPLNTKKCFEYLDMGDLAEVARISLLHYDKTYDFGYEQKKERVIRVPTETSISELYELIIKMNL